MSRDADIQRERVELFALALRDRLSAGKGPAYEDLVAMINGLPGGQAQAMRLHYLEGIKLREVARRMGRHHSTVQSLLRTGAIRLGAMLLADAS